MHPPSLLSLCARRRGVTPATRACRAGYPGDRAGKTVQTAFPSQTGRVYAAEGPVKEAARMVQKDVLATLRGRVEAVATGRAVTLVAASKSQPSAAIRELVAGGQHVFGENYVQEALAKQRELADLDIEWHMIGPLQSNKCEQVARHFDWLQSLDREKLIEPLARARPE